MNWLPQLPRVALRPGHRLCAPFLTSASRYSTVSVTLPPDIDFEELKQKLEDNKVTLIDVRVPRELHKVGRIPKSKNIILQTLGPQILLPDEEFAVQLGFEKPSLDEPIVVSCLAGIRARTAQLAMMAYGYNNVRVYAGSFEDWVQKGGPVEHPEAEI
ncbi:rhodanese domain-containing protein CG4456-like [Panulirus ornatus]|uniref:rhodanese domain-containing protein CG4456-like n=1 Tax=Panulirus ornatus TaxID=150431 RepID=UPI003A84D225